ncbi:hypothetical protein HDU97_005853 [Phlyctochytrium planicorne]|nr:hypothetical protein HDU97_005853 [Phlyctochytrium planicorne]
MIPTGTPPPQWILSPEKSPASTHPSILSLEVFLDDQPTVLKGLPESAPGTDLSGTISLALASDLDGERISISLFGAGTKTAVAVAAAAAEDGDAASAPRYSSLNRTEKAHPDSEAHRASSVSSIASSSSKQTGPDGSQEVNMLYCSSHEVWHDRRGGLNGPGAHEFRFLFKIPGHLPATDPVNGVRYVIRCLVLKEEIVQASLVEEVRIKRVYGDEDVEGDLPAYDGPPPLEADADASFVPPTYAEEGWKGKEKII